LAFQEQTSDQKHPVDLAEHLLVVQAFDDLNLYVGIVKGFPVCLYSIHHIFVPSGDQQQRRATNVYCACA
jgi:hypothetical protein